MRLNANHATVGAKMDPTVFQDRVPGRVVSIAGGEHAFIPDPLPPSIAFPIRLWPLLSEAKQQMGLLEGLGRNLPNPTILLRLHQPSFPYQYSRCVG
jgi:hypothetical protein